MIRVFGEGRISNSKLTPESMACFELNTFLGKGTDQPGYLCQTYHTEALEGSDITAEMGTIIQGMLSEQFKSLADVEIIDIGRCPVHGGHVYEGKGRANAAENRIMPHEHTGSRAASPSVPMARLQSEGWIPGRCDGVYISRTMVDQPKS